MGDVADHDFDSGLDGYLEHLRGECDQWCPYCEEDNGDTPSGGSHTDGPGADAGDIDLYRGG